MSETKIKNGSGRPLKFSNEELLEIINLYIKKYGHIVSRLSPSKLAEYSTKELHKPAHYQDFTRRKEVKKYIEKLNNNLKRELINTTSETVVVPIYQKLNIKKFIEKNNTKEKLERALILLDRHREKIHDSYGDLSQEFIKQVELTYKKDTEIKKIENKILEVESEKNEVIQKLKQEIKNLEKKNKKLRDKNIILESFVNRHHYETIVEYLLYIEGVISTGVKIDKESLIRLEDYKNGNFDLSEIISSLSYILEVEQSNNKSFSPDKDLGTIDEFFIEEPERIDESLDINKIKKSPLNTEKTLDEDKIREKLNLRAKEIEHEIFKGIISFE
ncbi:hypothetical protein [Neobacillus terrae]|uniref:hypothetical protein n=1 Tax=Neobacillus terrae TaxID=3034837 RepID=UPI00140C5C61|nr:hypothetical protein [Neobacillus terrae]NHM32076.1 hypothetical protein [Neobacillus terrae]